MLNKSLIALAISLITGIANASYMMHIPLEMKSGKGLLPSGSIQIVDSTPETPEEPEPEEESNNYIILNSISGNGNIIPPEYGGGYSFQYPIASYVIANTSNLVLNFKYNITTMSMSGHDYSFNYSYGTNIGAGFEPPFTHLDMKPTAIIREGANKHNCSLSNNGFNVVPNVIAWYEVKYICTSFPAPSVEGGPARTFKIEFK